MQKGKFLFYKEAIPENEIYLDEKPNFQKG
jgi:hypothetical protein